MLDQPGHPYESQATDGSYVIRYHEAPNLPDVEAQCEPMALVTSRSISTTITCALLVREAVRLDAITTP